MRTKTVTVIWHGLEIEAEVDIGTTPSGGPDPGSVESIRFIGIADEAAFLEWIGDNDSLHAALWDKVE